MDSENKTGLAFIWVAIFYATVLTTVTAYWITTWEHNTYESLEGSFEIIDQASPSLPDAVSEDSNSIY